MSATDFVLFEADHARIVAVLERLRQDANSKLCFLLDKNGQHIALSGDLAAIDATSLASLTAGNVAATDGLARLIGEREFSILFHEGEHDNLHINVISGKAILLVLFDLRSSLGLVRLRVKKASVELGAIMDEIVARSETHMTAAFGGISPFAEITDEDIDALFS